MTLWVIVEIVCLDTSAPYTSARWAWISPVVKPLADNEITISSTPVRRRCRLRTICCSQLAAPSLAHDLRLEAPAPVARHAQLARADLGQHRLPPHTVAGVAAVLAGRVAPVV